MRAIFSTIVINVFLLFLLYLDHIIVELDDFDSLYVYYTMQQSSGFMIFDVLYEFFCTLGNYVCYLLIFLFINTKIISIMFVITAVTVAVIRWTLAKYVCLNVVFPKDYISRPFCKRRLFFQTSRSILPFV